MNKSDSIKAISKALMTFHVKMETIKKTADNPFFKSKYAPLTEILPAIQLPLSEAGLVFSQFPDGDSLTTILMHPESGEFIEASYNLHPKAFDPQNIGSALTYARRYALCAILALNVDEDDDGNKASGNGFKPASQTTPPPKKDGPKLPWLNQGTPEYDKVVSFIQATDDREAAIKTIRIKWAVSTKVAEDLMRC